MAATDVDTITLRPTRALRAMSAVVTVVGIVAAIQWSLEVLDGAAAIASGSVLCLVIAVIGLRHQMSRVELTRSGATVRNTFRTRQVDWSEAARAEWTNTGGLSAGAILTFSGKARVVLNDGRRLSLSATTVLTYPAAAKVTAALRRTAGHAGVPVEPAATDGGPSRHVA